MPASNITGAEEFTQDDAERLNGEEYRLNQTFRATIETRAGTLLSSAAPIQIIDRRAKALDIAGSSKFAPKPA